MEKIGRRDYPQSDILDQCHRQRIADDGVTGQDDPRETKRKEDDMFSKMPAIYGNSQIEPAGISAGFRSRSPAA